jgi:hypothetical protein
MLTGLAKEVAKRRDGLYLRHLRSPTPAPKEPLIKSDLRLHVDVVQCWKSPRGMQVADIPGLGQDFVPSIYYTSTAFNTAL